MTNNKLFLLLGTSLSFLPQTLNAQCVSPIQDCYALGYTQTSCPNGKGVKCPFGNGWYCGGTAAQDCIKLGYDKDCTGAGESGSGETCNGKYKTCTCDSSYKYTCTGTGYSGGSGAACDDKYQSCTCASGYEWKDGGCTSMRPVCEIGSLYYSDNTCSNNKISGKTLLGVVIYSNGASGGGWIMTTKPIYTDIMWSDSSALDIPGLTNYTSTPSDIQASCTNTNTIISYGITVYGNSKEYLAAWAAQNYKPSGTPSEKSWCLPSGGLLNSALNNSAKLAIINAGITTAKGTIIGNVYNNEERIWSSSEYRDRYAWVFYISKSNSFGMDYYVKNFYGDPDYSVRPVLDF